MEIKPCRHNNYCEQNVNTFQLLKDLGEMEAGEATITDPEWQIQILSVISSGCEGCPLSDFLEPLQSNSDSTEEAHKVVRNIARTYRENPDWTELVTDPKLPVLRIDNISGSREVTARHVHLGQRRGRKIIGFASRLTVSEDIVYIERHNENTADIGGYNPSEREREVIGDFVLKVNAAEPNITWLQPRKDAQVFYKPKESA